jgi:hypothetical protein
VQLGGGGGGVQGRAIAPSIVSSKIFLVVIGRGKNKNKTVLETIIWLL